MKCEVIRDDLEAADSAQDDLTVMREVMRNGAITPVRFMRKGAIIDHPKAYMLVRMGVAVPADEACAQRAARNKEQMAAAQKGYERVRLGIHPEDYEKFDAGVIAGYNGDGSYIPGPNFHLLKQDEDTEEDE